MSNASITSPPPRLIKENGGHVTDLAPDEANPL